MGETFQNILNTLGSWALKLLVFLAILVVGWVVSRFIGRIVDRVLNRVGFNRLAERTKLRRWTGRYEPSSLVGKIVYYAAVLFTLQIAFMVFGPNPISSLISAIIAWLPRLFVAVVIIVVVIAIANAVFDIISNALSRFSYGRWLGRAAQVIIVALGLIAALSQIGIAMSVTIPVLIAVLATIGGVIVVGVGGGLIQPMRERWERMLSRAEHETTKVTGHLRSQGANRGDGITQPGYVATSADRDMKAAADRAASSADERVKAAADRATQQGREQQGREQQGREQQGREQQGSEEPRTEPGREQQGREQQGREQQGSEEPRTEPGREQQHREEPRTEPGAGG